MTKTERSEDRETVNSFIRWKMDTGESLETIWWEAQRRFPTRRITWENVLRLKNKQRVNLKEGT